MTYASCDSERTQQSAHKSLAGTDRMNAAYYISAFKMQPHPEGGYFAETYRSEELIPQTALPGRFNGNRSFGTAIYFLLESHHVSHLHRIQSDEIWHFYAGSPLEIFVIDADGSLATIRLGNNPDQGDVFQAVVPAGCWFGSKPAVDTATVSTAGVHATFSFVGCTVAPGFDFADFELADRSALLAEYPQHREIIERLTI